MVDSDIARVREDLEVVKRAVGLEPPFRREEILLGLGHGPAGIFAAIWPLLPHGLDLTWGFLPLVVLAIAYAVCLERRYKHRAENAATTKREYLVYMAIVVFIVVFRLWSKRLGLPVPTTTAVVELFLGVAAGIWVVQERRRSYLIPWAVFLIAAGLVTPFLKVPMHVPIAVAIALAGPSSAFMQIRQLRRYRVAYGQAAD